MTKTARLFMNGRSQAVRLPKEFRFEGDEVEIRRDPKSGGVLLLERKPRNFDEFIRRIDDLKPSDIPEGFPHRDMSQPERGDPLG